MLSSFTENLKNGTVLVKTQEKSLLTCSWGWIKTSALSLDLKNELLNHMTSGESRLSFNHPTNIAIEPKS